MPSPMEERRRSSVPPTLGHRDSRFGEQFSSSDDGEEEQVQYRMQRKEPERKFPSSSTRRSVNTLISEYVVMPAKRGSRF